MKLDGDILVAIGALEASGDVLGIDVASVTADSRRVTPGALFVAVRGEVIGSNVAPWVMLKKYEFVDMFAPAEAVQLQ